MIEDMTEETKRREFIEIEEEKYNKLLENEEYYKTAIGLIKDELYGLKGLKHEYCDIFGID